MKLLTPAPYRPTNTQPKRARAAVPSAGVFRTIYGALLARWRRRPWRATISSPAGGTILLDSTSGVEVHCQRGCLWITQAGDRRDYVLGPNQRWSSAKGDRVAIQTLHDAQWMLRLDRPPRKPLDLETQR